MKQGLGFLENMVYVSVGYASAFKYFRGPVTIRRLSVVVERLAKRCYEVLYFARLGSL